MDRLVRGARTVTSLPSAGFLLASNAVPLAGVLFLGWSLWTILVLYWLENGIIGFFDVLKMAAARGGSDRGAGSSGSSDGGSSGGGSPGGSSSSGRASLIPFFVVHYGLFWVVHGIFVWTIPAFLGRSEATVVPGSPGVDVHVVAGAFGQPPSVGALVVGVAALLISHGASYRLNFIGNGEYLRASPARLMFAPYQRVVVLHLTILVGAFAAFLLGTPVWMLVILVVLKTAIDLRAHLAERGRAAAVSA